jgi:hypothetical protein
VIAKVKGQTLGGYYRIEVIRDRGYREIEVRDYYRIEVTSG